MNTLKFLISFLAICLMMASCKSTTIDTKPMAGTLDAPLLTDSIPAHVQKAMDKALKLHNHEVMSDTASNIAVFSIDEIDQTPSEGFGFVVTKGAVSTNFLNILNTRQPQAKYNVKTGDLWLTSCAMSGTGVNVEKLYQIRFQEDGKAYIKNEINPYAVQQELLQRIHASQQTISTVLDDKNRLLQEFNELQTEQDFLIQQHEEYILQKNAEIKDLEANLLKLETELQKFSSVDMEATFKKTDIFKLFDERKNPQYINKPPKDKDWQQLTTLFRTHFVRYYSFIAIAHRLPVNQFRYCILLRLGFDGNDIGILMNKDRDQRYNLRKFIYEELFGKPVQVKLLEEKLKQHF